MDEPADPFSRFSGIPASRRLAFRAMRNGSELGTHTVAFAARDDTLTVSIAIDYVVKLGFIAVFRYTLRATETWAGGVLMAVRAKTDNNGKPEYMRALREDGTLMVEGSRAPRYRAPAGAMLCSHWNKAQLGEAMLNPQDGTLLTFSVSPKGPARIRDTAGRLRETERFGMVAKHSVDLWYDVRGVWTALEGTVQDGSVITYLPVG